MRILTRQRGVLIAVITVMLVIAGCTVDTSYNDAINIIEPEQVIAEMANGNVVLVDARNAERYNVGHAEGAINLSPDLLNGDGPVKAMLAEKEKVEAVLGAYGISNDSAVYIYDENSGVYAGRVWWSLKVYGHENVKIINGGTDGLLAAGINATAELPTVEAKEYTAKALDTSLYATLEDVQAAIEDDSIKIIDVRSRQEFDEGAIPTAILYSHSNNCYADGTFKSAEAIYMNYHDLEYLDQRLEREDEIILYCKSSFRATQTLALLQEAGFENVKVYDGAWLEWQVKDMPAAEPETPAQPTTQDAS